MADELEALKQAFERVPRWPRHQAREEAINAALAHFDLLHSRRKGFGLLDRLMGTAGGREPLSRRRSMQIGYALAGSASLAVLAIAVINTNQLRTETPPLVSEAPREVKTSTSSRNSLASRLEKKAEVRENESGRAASLADKDRESLASSSPSASALPMDSLSETVLQSAPSRDASSFVQEYRADEQSIPGYHDQGRDKFSDIVANPVKVTAQDPVSTFSIDVDSSSYSFVRASLNNNVLPQKDAVRVEELINYFPYDYPSPEDRAVPFKPTVSIFPTPWNPATKLVHVGIKGFMIEGKEKPPANLVFLIDTSASMDEPNKLPLLRNAMKMLVETLAAEDKVAIVAYAGNAGTILPPTEAKDKAKILTALDGLTSAGSTAGAEGIRQAYQLAEQNFNKLGINRVILATDGDFNVGITDPQELKSFVERKRETGVFLSVLGFGMGNYNDELMQALAQNGNGNAAYIDNLNEARKALVDGASAMLFPIAKDVKIQIEFNPQTVSEYRLIGYETRILNREDFNNDKVDAGDIGAGHTVTALYEITPTNSAARLTDPLRYGGGQSPAQTISDEYGFLKIRYKLPDSNKSQLITSAVTKALEVPSLSSASQEARFAAAVAAFGQLLRGGQYTGNFGYQDVIDLAQSAKGSDDFGYRTEFINLVRIAKTAQTLEPLPK
jgi:Ca-activated chloride channel homolog